jgi:hypothetical protein
MSSLTQNLVLSGKWREVPQPRIERKSMSLDLRYEGRMRRSYQHALADFHMMCDTKNDTENGTNEPNPNFEQ